jgi:hypothetical protein
MNTQLLCLFTYRNELDTSLQFVLKNYTLINPNIFVLESKNAENDLFITYNVEKGSAPIDSQWKTILVHRKKQSNTIYTINALNEVIKSKTGGHWITHISWIGMNIEIVSLPLQTTDTKKYLQKFTKI